MNSKEKREQLLKNVRIFSEANGPAGFEHELAGTALQILEPYGETYIDPLQNVYMERSANSRDRVLVQLDAHLDEVGLIVQSVSSQGLLRILPLGSWVASNVPSHRFRVRNSVGDWIPALATSKPPHYMSEAERSSPIDFSSIQLDVGASSAEEISEKFKIRIAAPVVPDVDLYFDEKNDVLIGKAFDCRLGCTALMETVIRLEQEALSCDVIAALSTQEEVGGRGAEVSTRSIMPDLAIVFEGTPADDTFGSADSQQTLLGKGPMLRHMDRSMITHPGFQRFALDLAEREGIPVQEAVRSGGGTNGGQIHKTGGGIPTIVLGVPVRYIHTPYGIAKLHDLEKTIELAVALLKSINDDTYEEILAGKNI
ncbi:MAG: M42 family peptidase [Eubacteriales bacterium]|nr:M42 family peptidase [Eubacteriales bacterium]MDD4324290.1 M42 family peptidase [Eubacteriales bacterium]MDD4541201.1 M42 family peptidase [Eubacteriales bacterium]